MTKTNTSRGKIEKILRKQQDESVVWLSDEVGEIVNELMELFETALKQQREEIVKEIKKEMEEEKRIDFWLTVPESVGKYTKVEDEDGMTITIKEMKALWDSALKSAISKIQSIKEDI